MPYTRNIRLVGGTVRYKKPQDGPRTTIEKKNKISADTIRRATVSRRTLDLYRGRGCVGKIRPIISRKKKNKKNTGKNSLYPTPFGQNSADHNIAYVLCVVNDCLKFPATEKRRYVQQKRPRAEVRPSKNAIFISAR